MRKFDRKRPKDEQPGDGRTSMIRTPRLVPRRTGRRTPVLQARDGGGSGQRSDCGGGDFAGSSSGHKASTHIWKLRCDQRRLRRKAALLTVERSPPIKKPNFELTNLQALQHEQIKTVICDPISNRRLDKLDESEQRVVKAAQRSTKANTARNYCAGRVCTWSGRSPTFWTVGGCAARLVRGRQNLNKQFKLAAAFYSLSQLMRNLFGIRHTQTMQKRWAQAGWERFWGVLHYG